MLRESERLHLLDLVEEGYRESREMFSRLSNTYVPGEGNYEQPEAFIIGEAPGAVEDAARRPFVGKAGQILRQLMVLADLWSTTVKDSNQVERYPGAPNCWLTNVVKHRPAGNATPTPVEVNAFRRYLQEEWHAVGEPTLLIPVGAVALRAVTGKPLSILRAAGKCHKYRSTYTGKLLHIWPMVHPAWVIRQGDNTALQELIEQDWERLGEWRRAQNS